MSAKGQQRRPRAPRRAKQEARPEVSEEWLRDQQDPANWLRVPEFGVQPADVAFEGFAFPILHPNAPMRAVRENVRELVRAARTLVAKEVATLKEQRVVHIEWLDALDRDPTSQPTQKQYAAAAYGIVMQQLEFALRQTEPHGRSDRTARGVEQAFSYSMQALSVAAVLLLEWSARHPSRRALSVAMSTLGKKGRQKTLIETEAMQSEVRQWCEQRLGHYDSLNKLRDAAIAAKLNAAKSSTVRGWLTGWAKEWKEVGRWPPAKPTR